MNESDRLRYVTRELALAAFQASVSDSRIEPWVFDRMMSLIIEEKIGAGQTIYNRGDAPESGYFMTEGRVRLSREGATPWILEGRWGFGMLDVAGERPRSRTAVMLTDAQLWKLPADGYIELLEDSFTTARNVFTRSVNDIARLYDRQLPNAEIVEGTAAPVVPLPSGRLDLVERLLVLMELPYLRGAGAQTLADLAATTDELAFDTGEVVLERGAPRDRVLVIADGEVEARREHSPAVFRFGAGTLAGGAAAHELTWHARALRPTRMLAFHPNDWLDEMEEHFDMFRSAMAALRDERERLIERIALPDGIVLK
jgi:CRP-like cAMP-binding protein